MGAYTTFIIAAIIVIALYATAIISFNKEKKSTTENWIKYDFNKPETRPKRYGKYFICRKDGKVHWETWNGSGWAYNNKSIAYYKEIIPP